MQCRLVLCRKRKMIFTSSRSRLSITTPRTGSYQLHRKTLGRAVSEFAGDSQALNLQAGVPGGAFACHALSKFSRLVQATQDVLEKERLAKSGHVGRRIACGQVK